MPSTLDQAYTRERLKLVLDSTRLGMWDWNPQTDEVIFDRNWAAMLGLTLDDLTMTLSDWSCRVHPDDMDKCMQDIQAHLSGEVDFYENLHRMKHVAGHWVYILDRGKVVEYDAQGRPVRFTGTHADVTPLKKAEFEASLALKSRERFFSAMSHELRAPLHAMLGIVAHVSKQLDDDELTQQLAVVQDSGQHLLQLIRDVLDLSKIRNASLQLNISRFDVTELVAHVIELFHARAREKGLLLQADIPSGCTVLQLETDFPRLSQVLINLVSNAIKFTGQGSVTVRLRLDAAALRLEVVDTGVGINDVASVFQPYFSLDHFEHFDDVHSTGLGLSISRELTAVMGLQLDVESRPGQGSVFSVTIPLSLVRNLSDSALTAAVQNRADRVERVNTDKWPRKSLLVVDDSPINLMLTEMMLEETPLDIYTVACVDDALRVLQKQPMDIVLSDLHMPQHGGLDLTQRLRSAIGLAQPVIIITSADARDDVWERCRSAGVDDYLEKPFDELQLYQLLNRYLVTA